MFGPNTGVPISCPSQVKVRTSLLVRHDVRVRDLTVYSVKSRGTCPIENSNSLTTVNYLSLLPLFIGV